MSAHSSFRFHAIPANLLPEASHCLIQASAWFQGWLYLGITIYPADARQPGSAILLRHHLRESGWERLHTSPVESPWIAHQGQLRRFPLELGWRTLSVLPGKEQLTPLLYALRLSLRTPALLYSVDGAHFQELPSPGDPGPLASLRSFSGQVFAIPASAAHDTNGDGPLLWVSADPHSPAWRPAHSPGFGDPETRTLDSLQVFNGQLYAAAGNPTNGFRLWKTTARGEPPFAWEPVLTEGAQRYTLNPYVETMTVFKDALYVGTRSLKPDPQWEFATAGAEILRVLPDDRWELVMGTPRFSPIGLQIPLSTQGPGFGDPFNQRVSRLMGTPDALYAAIDSNADLFNVDPASESTGFHLWKTRDGEDWQPVTSDSFGQRAALALHILQPTPLGLVAAGNWNLALDSAAQPGFWLEERTC